MIPTLFVEPTRPRSTWRFASLSLVSAAALLLFANGCGKESAVRTAPAKSQESPESEVQVTTKPDAVLVDTPAAEFAIAPNGYVAASLLSGGRKLSLDDAASRFRRPADDGWQSSCRSCL